MRSRSIPTPAFRKSTCIRFAPTSLSPSDRRGSSRSRGIHYKLPVLGFRIGPLAYLTDMNRIDEREIDKIRGVDTLVINALRKEPHLSHFTLDEALRISRAVSSNVTYLTHVSHQMGRHAEEQAALPEGVYFAYDGLTVEIPE